MLKLSTMAEYVSAFAPDSLPALQYTRVNEEQAACIQAAMEDPENQAKFDIAFLPVDTAEERLAAAVEWAAYRQAVGQVNARDRGAILVVNSRDESPEALARLLAGEDIEGGRSFVTHALMRVVKKNGKAQVFDLLRKYYEQD